MSEQQEKNTKKEENFDQILQTEKQDSLNDEERESCERTNRFFERAFAETQRMNSCVYESEEIQAKLREEFGSRIFSEWLQEHTHRILLSMPKNGPPA